MEEIKSMGTPTLELILSDQKELYSDEEIKLIENELKLRRRKKQN